MRQPDWDIDKARGEEAEQLFRRLRSAMASGTVEVKCDDRAAETGNVYVEQECLTAQGWMPSGINTTKATFWVWVLLDMRLFIGMPVWLLRNVAKTSGRSASCTTGSHPTRGAVVSITSLAAEPQRAVRLYGAPERKAA